MKLSRRLENMIEEYDLDEGELLQAVMLDPDSKVEEMESAIYDFLVALPEYDPMYEYKTHLFIQNNLLDDDDEDDTEEDEEDADLDPEFLQAQRELEEDTLEDVDDDDDEDW